MIILLNISLLVIIALTILFSQNLLVDVVLLTIFSLLMTFLYVLMNSPDVAITEAAVNSMLGTIFILTALILSGNKTTINIKKNTIIIVSFIVFFSLVLISPITSQFPEFSAFLSPVNNEISNYYISETINKLGFTNIVTGILASFRGFDTFIETVVIFSAANSIYMIMGTNETDQ